MCNKPFFTSIATVNYEGEVRMLDYEWKVKVDFAIDFEGMWILGVCGRLEAMQVLKGLIWSLMARGSVRRGAISMFILGAL